MFCKNTLLEIFSRFEPVFLVELVILGYRLLLAILYRVFIKFDIIVFIGKKMFSIWKSCDINLNQISIKFRTKIKFFNNFAVLCYQFDHIVTNLAVFCYQLNKYTLKNCVPSFLRVFFSRAKFPLCEFSHNKPSFQRHAKNLKISVGGQISPSKSINSLSVRRNFYSFPR